MEQTPSILDYQGKLPLDVACAGEVESSARTMNVMYILFQRMIGDASLSFKNFKMCPREWFNESMEYRHSIIHLYN